MPEVYTFLRDAWTAAENARIAQEAAAESARIAREAAARAAADEAQRLRRKAASVEYGMTGAGAGATLGGIVLGFAGCCSCVANVPTQGTLMTDFNLFNGLLYGAIGGAVIGAVIGIMIGQSKD